MSKKYELGLDDKRPPGPLIHESYAPLQKPSNAEDKRVYSATYGGPQANLDTRMLITGRMIEHLTKVAAQSHVGAATIVSVGLQIDVYEKPDGQTYEVWQFIGRPPVPSKSWRG